MFHPPALTTCRCGKCLRCLIQINECNSQEALRVDFLLWRSLSPLGKYLNLRSALSASCWGKAMFWVLGLGGSVQLWVQSRVCVCVYVCVCVRVDTDNWTFISSSSRENSRSPSKHLSSSSHEYPLLKYAHETLFCIYATEQPRFFNDIRFFIQ